MSDLFQVVFEWPHPEPTEVIVTGTFDNWAAKQHLTKTATGFEAKVGVPWGAKIYYKYVVDGTWQPHEDQPTEPDHDGNINNWLTIPSKPAEPAPALSLPETAAVAAAGAISAAATAVKEATAPIVEAVTNSISSTNEVADIASAAPAAADEIAPKDVAEKETTTDIDMKPAAEMTVEPALPATPEVVAPVVPVVVEPVADAANDTTAEMKTPAEVPAAEQPSTHTPAIVAPEPEMTTPPPVPSEDSKPAAPEPVMEPAPVASTEAPTAEPMASSPPPATPEKPHTNGTTPTATPAASAPPTPSKKPFPVVEDDTGSMTSSKNGSMRKKRTSIFGKLKHIFHHEKGDKAKEASH